MQVREACRDQGGRRFQNEDMGSRVSRDRHFRVSEEGSLGSRGSQRPHPGQLQRCVGECVCAKNCSEGDRGGPLVQGTRREWC